MASITHTRWAEAVETRDRRRQMVDKLYAGWFSFVGLGTCVLIVSLILYIVYKGAPAMSWKFLTSPPTEGMSAGGIYPMIRGSLLLMLGTLMIVLPIGILGGIFLAEYAGQNRAMHLIRACVVTLAGTPPIVYGLFGLAIFVLMFKFGISLLSGWLTLALFAMPSIVLITETAIRAVPDSLTEGGLALGLSRWQTMWRIVLPNALPSILTGILLSTGRAAGEATPILLTAGIYFSTEHLRLTVDTFKKPVANLPYHLAEGYRQGGVIPEKIIWGTCLTLMLLVLLINLGAILMRARIRRHQQW